MSLADRFKLFGGPTETLAAEAVWLFKRERGDWPIWEEALDFLAESPEVSGDLAEADRRLVKAIATGEVHPSIRAAGHEFGLTLSPEMADAISRRYLDASMPRRDREDTC